MNRYNRHIVLDDVGVSGQFKLNQAKVLVVGAGGLGCPVLQYLSAAGVGTLGVIDFDIVEESNLQRQILYGRSTLGQNKAIAAKERLLDINEDITVKAYPEALTHQNAEVLFSDYDIIIDGSDNFSTRYLINDAAVRENKPFVFGAVYKYEGQVSVFNFNNGPSYRCLFPNPPKKNSIPNCSEVGVLGVLPGIIGSMQANEVIKMILGFEHVLSGILYCYNSRTTEISTIAVSKSESEFNNIINRKGLFQDDYDVDICENEHREITIEEAIQKKDTLFIDVREPHETPKIKTLNHLNIPLNKLYDESNKIDKNKTIILFCKSGIRSKKAISILKTRQFHNCFSIKNGAMAIEHYLNINV